MFMINLFLLVGSIFANPIGFDFASFDVSGEILYTVMYNGNPVPRGSLIQILRPNGTLHPPSSAAGDLGAVTDGDIINSMWQIGEGTEADGLFSLFLTAQSTSLHNTQTPTSLNAGAFFYIRIWSDVAYGTATPFPSGSHYVDGGPYIAPTSDASYWDMQVNPTSALPNWQVCGAPTPIMNVTEVAGTSITTPLNFGSSVLGTPVTHTIRISNSGNAELTLSNGSIYGDFTYSALTTPIIGGGHLDVTITFNPSTTGTRISIFGFNHNGAGGSYALTLTGTGLPVPASALSVTEVGGAAISPPLNLGSTLNGTSVSHTIRLRNTGGSPLTIDSVATTGDFSHGAVPSSLLPGNYADVVLTFTPTIHGTRTGNFRFDHNASGSPYTLALTGIGIWEGPQFPRVTVNGTPVGSSVVQFGADTIGSMTTDKVFQIFNCGPDSIRVTNLSCTGPFSLVGTHTYPVIIASSATYDVTVRYTPTVAGHETGTFSFFHTGSAPLFFANLEGTAIAADRWVDGNDNSDNNPTPGANPLPWHPSFPPDPETNNLPPIILEFSGNVGLQPSTVVVNYVTSYPTGLPVGGFTGSGIYNPMPYNANDNIQRWWQIDQTGGAGFRARVELYFTDTDLPAGFGDPRLHTPRLMALAYHLGVWNYYYPVIDLYAAGTPNVWRATIYNVQQFSTWALTAQPVTPVTALTMDASAGDRQVTLHWRVATEINNWGFEIERKLNDDPSGNWTLIHREQSKADGGNSSVPLNYYYVDNYNLENGRTYTYRITDKALDGTTTSNASRTATPQSAVVNEYSLSSYPNPFNSTTRISYSMMTEGNVKITIMNILGQTNATLVNGNVKRGSQSINWNAKDLPSGNYFVKMETSSFSTTRQILLTK